METTNHEPKNDAEKLASLLISRSNLIGSIGDEQILFSYGKLLLLGTLYHGKGDQITTAITPSNTKQVMERWTKEEMVEIKRLFNKLCVPDKTNPNYFITSSGKTFKETRTQFKTILENLNGKIKEQER